MQPTGRREAATPDPPPGFFAREPLHVRDAYVHKLSTAELRRKCRQRTQSTGRATGRTHAGHRQDRGRTQAGHKQDTARTQAGHRQDTGWTQAGHRQDTGRTQAQHTQSKGRT